MDYPVTPDGRYFVVRCRLWRCTNPKLSTKRREKFIKELMAAHRTKNRAGVDKAKRALGERGPTWWNGSDYNRHLVKNTPYADWWNNRFVSPLLAKREASMAVNKPTGDNAREGAVKDRIQFKNPITKTSTKRNKEDSEFMAVKCFRCDDPKKPDIVRRSAKLERAE